MGWRQCADYSWIFAKWVGMSRYELFSAWMISWLAGLTNKHKNIELRKISDSWGRTENEGKENPELYA